MYTDKELTVSRKERVRIRELAEKIRELSSLPVMHERKSRWYRHNRLEKGAPMLVMEIPECLENEIYPAPQCTSAFAREIERILLRDICNYEMIGDDKVITPEFLLPLEIERKLFGLETVYKKAVDLKGREFGHIAEHPIQDITKDLSFLKPSINTVNKKYNLKKKEIAESVLGDILTVENINQTMNWGLSPSIHVINLMGMEKLMMAMMDYPEKVHELYNFITEDTIRYLRWEEEEDLLCLNNGNHYAGAGSYGFTDELPALNYKTGMKLRSVDIWGNLNSQETVGISPAMHNEFAFPYYQRLAREFGLVYYGCCEPIHDIFKTSVQPLPNLRKVSVSAWCDEELAGSLLSENRIIYSRKPSPNYIGLDRFDSEGYRASINKTLSAAKNCTLEIIHRDVMTVNNDALRMKKAIEIARQCIEDRWR